MADFRRCFTVLAVIALMAFAASAQIGTGNGSQAGALTCGVSAAAPQLRPEGFSELVGDILISCTGGTAPQVGSPVSVANITVYIAGGPTAVTSRYLASNGASEAVLVIDDAGAGLVTGATGGYGPSAAQKLCSYNQQVTSGGTNQAGACPAYVGLDLSGNYQVPITTSVTTPGAGLPAANVYQGKIGDFGANTVTFYSVPILPPATGNVTHTYRITNVRVPVVGLSPQGQVSAFLSTNQTGILPISSTGVTVGIVGQLSKAQIKQQGQGGSGSTFQQCVKVPVTTPQVTANLIFTEGFATAFKTRVVPGGAANLTPGSVAGNVLYAAEATNSSAPGAGANNQNIPGGSYGGFSTNSESGFIYPGLNTSSGQVIAGLADYGTRLKAVFTNVPSGLTLYVSVTSVNNAAPTPVGGLSLVPFAVLVSAGNGEATPDSSSSGSFTPIPATSGTLGADGSGIVALSQNLSNGQYEAVWEVTNSNPSAVDNLVFNAYIAYTPVAGSSSATPGSLAYYGTPLANGLPAGTATNNVVLTLAPEPVLEGTFSATTLQGTGLPIPRFTLSPATSGQFTTINLCQTTLLYPFITGASGFDTGIAVANTSWDPWGTTSQSGSCTLYGYGVSSTTAGTSGIGTGPTAVQPVIQGCDQGVANPLPGTNCFPIVQYGQVGAVQASGILQLQGFQGYVIAVCNFQYAHGYAAVTDLGIRNIFSSYLALELNNNSVGSSNRGTKNGGEQGAENLVH